MFISYTLLQCLLFLLYVTQYLCFLTHMLTLSAIYFIDLDIFTEMSLDVRVTGVGGRHGSHRHPCAPLPADPSLEPF